MMQISSLAYSDFKKLQCEVVKNFSLDKTAQRFVSELFPRGILRLLC
jgi:hypothetical protein